MANKVTTAKEYRQKIRKTVTAPSGSTFIIKKVTARDFISSPYLPLNFDYEQFLKSTQSLPQNPDELSKDPTKYIKQLSEILNIYVVVGVVEPRVALKPPDECRDDELSVFELDENDVTFLVAEIMKLSGGDKGTLEQIVPFPEQPEPVIVGSLGEKV